MKRVRVFKFIYFLIFDVLVCFLFGLELKNWLIWFNMIVKIISDRLLINFVLMLVCWSVDNILWLSLGVLIIDFVIIIERVNIIVWLIFVIIVFLVSGSLILNNFCLVVELNELDVFINLSGILWIVKLVKCIVGGKVNIIEVKIFGIILILKKVIVGIR